MWLCILTRVLTSFFFLFPSLTQSSVPSCVVFSHILFMPSVVSRPLLSNFQHHISCLFSIAILHLRRFLYLLFFLCTSPTFSAAVSQCDQDQCIQSTKFVLQAATTPLLQQQSSEPVILTASPENGGSLPARTSLTLGGPCTSLPLGQPTPPTSTPSLSCHEPTDMLPIHGHSHTHNHSHPLQEPVAHHHFLTPEEVPSPPGMLPCGSPLGHSHTIQAGFYNPASQDSLHEDSVRGLVKLSSV